jgi:hypothetical protein
MTITEPVRSTLRVLMSPPRLMRTNICAFKHASSSVTNLALELWPTRTGFSMLELCSDGELQSGRDVGAPAGNDGELNDTLLSHAMHALWADEPGNEVEMDELASIRTTSLLLAERGEDCFRVVQSWYYRERDGFGLLDVWSDATPTRTHVVPVPRSRSLRAMVAELQAVACAMKD